MSSNDASKKLKRSKNSGGVVPLVAVGSLLLVILAVVALVASPRHVTDLGHGQKTWEDAVVASWKADESSSSTGKPKVALITGATRGLGYGTAVHLQRLAHQADQSMHLILAVRNVTHCEELFPANNDELVRFSCLALDLASSASIRQFARDTQSVLQSSTATTTTSPPIHYLINNAGMWAQYEQPVFVEDTEITMQVNHVGHALLTHLLWPNLVEGRARIVAVSSFVAIFPGLPTYGWTPTTTTTTATTTDSSNLFWNSWNTLAVYFRAKRANLYWTVELQRRLGSSQGVTAVAAHPGFTRSHFMLQGMQFLPAWVRQVMHLNPFMSMSVLDGAQSQVRAALDPRLDGGSYVGPQFPSCGQPLVLTNLVSTTTSAASSPFSWLRRLLQGHHWPFSEHESRDLWDQTLQHLGIVEFGKEPHNNHDEEERECGNKRDNCTMNSSPQVLLQT